MTKLDGIPVTTVIRTLFDISAAVPLRDLERALAEAFDRRLATRAALLSRLARRGPHRGTARLRGVLEAGAPPALTRSEAEERFLAFIRKARLPEPRANVRIGDYEVDFFWRDEGLVVEVDGRAFHSTQASFESDRRRDADHLAAGMRVMRLTWWQIVNEPEALVVSLGQALARTG